MYRPIAERQAELFIDYGFKCDCLGCCATGERALPWGGLPFFAFSSRTVDPHFVCCQSAVDRTRAFPCPRCAVGVVHPLGNGGGGGGGGGDARALAADAKGESKQHKARNSKKQQRGGGGKEQEAAAPLPAAVWRCLSSAGGCGYTLSADERQAFEDLEAVVVEL